MSRARITLARGEQHRPHQLSRPPVKPWIAQTCELSLFRPRRLERLLFCLVLACLSQNSSADTFDGAAFLKLPQHCQGFYANAARAGQLPGVVVDLSQYEVNLSAMLGSAAGSLNRYCPALAALWRETRRDPRPDAEDANRKARLNAVLGGFEAQLSKTTWNESNIWFKSEVLTNIGRALELLGEQDKAVEVFESAIETFPPYVPAYWELAAMHEANSEPALAADVLRETKKVRLPKTTRLRIDEKLEELEAFEKAQ